MQLRVGLPVDYQVRQMAKVELIAGQELKSSIGFVGDCLALGEPPTPGGHHAAQLGSQGDLRREAVASRPVRR
jgi:hypothetical protein